MGAYICIVHCFCGSWASYSIKAGRFVAEVSVNAENFQLSLSCAVGNVAMIRFINKVSSLQYCHAYWKIVHNLLEMALCREECSAVWCQEKIGQSVIFGESTISDHPLCCYCIILHTHWSAINHCQQVITIPSVFVYYKYLYIFCNLTCDYMYWC